MFFCIEKQAKNDIIKIGINEMKTNEKCFKKQKNLKKEGDKKMKNSEKGITLIALIITIIVMLILVAVTISVALNGGIFDRAKTASDKTQRQAEKEELISAMVGAYTTGGKFATSNVGELPGDARWCNENTEVWSEDLNVNPTGKGDWIITTNNNKFYIDSSGSVLDEKPQEIQYSFNAVDLYAKDGETPFTLDNVEHIKKMFYLLIACIILSAVGEVILNIPLKGEVDLDINLLNIVEILFLYSMSLVFEYGHEIQLDSKGKMYDEE